MSQIEKMEVLSGLLEKMHALLVGHEVNYAEVLSPILLRIKKGDIFGVDELLQYYGGMGSLNDIWICTENEHNISKEQEQSVNKEFDSLKNSAWETAREIQAVK